MKNIGNRIKELRLLKKMNQKDFAKQIGVTQASLSSYENEIKQPSLDVLSRIAGEFNVSLDWLCSNSDTHHFVTGTDIIDFLLELNELHGLDFQIESEITHDISEKYNYKSTLTFEESRKRKDSFDKKFDKSDLTDFLKEYSDLIKKLNSLDDEDIKKNYFEMWLEKKREHYSHYTVVYKDDKRKELTEELLNQIEFKLGSGDE